MLVPEQDGAVQKMSDRMRHNAKHKETENEGKKNMILIADWSVVAVLPLGL